jgi:hypothetical protein
MDKVSGRGNLWSIVPAGGSGVRIGEFIRRWLGYKQPKQYRAVFQHTLNLPDRSETSDLLGQPARITGAPDQSGKQPVRATEPLPFLYQG